MLFVGRLTSEKAPDVLVDAWERAGLDYQLDVIGVGPLDDALRRRGVRNVTLRGQLNQQAVREAMLSARALVLPSIWYEGLSMVLLEALAAGLPVIASDIGPIPEVVAALGPDWLAKPGDAGDLAKRLAQLTDDDGGGHGRSRRPLALRAEVLRRPGPGRPRSGLRKGRPHHFR